MRSDAMGRFAVLDVEVEAREWGPRFRALMGVTLEMMAARMGLGADGLRAMEGGAAPLPGYWGRLCQAFGLGEDGALAATVTHDAITHAVRPEGERGFFDYYDEAAAAGDANPWAAALMGHNLPGDYTARVRDYLGSMSIDYVRFGDAWIEVARRCAAINPGLARQVLGAVRDCAARFPSGVAGAAGVASRAAALLGTLQRGALA